MSGKAGQTLKTVSPHGVPC